jgi:translation elongation factor EF-1beta
MVKMPINKRINELAELYETSTSTKLTEKEKELIGFGFKQAVLDSAWEDHEKETEKLEYKLIWNEDGDTVWGLVSDFNSENEFFAQIEAEYLYFNGTKCNYIPGDVKKEWMILTGEGLPAEMIIPIRNLDIQVSQYYSIEVYEAEETKSD